MQPTGLQESSAAGDSPGCPLSLLEDNCPIYTPAAAISFFQTWLESDTDQHRGGVGALPTLAPGRGGVTRLP